MNGFYEFHDFDAVQKALNGLSGQRCDIAARFIKACEKGDLIAKKKASEALHRHDKREEKFKEKAREYWPYID